MFKYVVLIVFTFGFSISLSFAQTTKPPYVASPYVDRHLSDDEIKKNIEDKIASVYEDGSVDITVSVVDGDVVLDGWMTNEAQRYVLTSILSSIDGVRSLQNNAYVEMLNNKDY